MVDGISFSFTQSASDVPHPRLTVDSYQLIPAGENMGILRPNGPDCLPLLVSLPLASSLPLCRSFAPLGEHAQRVAQALHNADVAYVLRSLQALNQHGLFVTPEQWLQRLQPTENIPDGSSVDTTVVLRTCERRDELVARLGEWRVRYGPNRALIVLDDSSRAETVGSNREACRQLAKEGVPVFFSGRAQWDVVAVEALAGPDPGLWRWLLCSDETAAGNSYGAALNRALLMSAGRRVALVDDDAQLSRVYAETQGGGTRPASLGADPYTVRYLAVDESLDRDLEQIHVDPIAAHEALLGLPIGAIVQPDDALWQGWESRIDAATLTRVSRASTVKLTVNGVVGDSGSPSNLRLVLDDPEALGRAAHDADVYAELRRMHHVQRLRSGLNLSPVSILTAATMVGIDNRSLVPPVLPLGRGEDYLFSAALEFLYPRLLVAELPWGLMHAPERRRKYDPELPERPMTPTHVQILAEAIRGASAGCRALEPDARLACLSNRVMEWSTLSEKAFERFWQEMVLAARGALLGELEKSFGRHVDSVPSVRAHIQHLMRINSNFQPNAIALAHAAEVQRLWGLYGRALAQWSALWAAFREHGPDRFLVEPD